MRLPINALAVGRNELSDGTVLDINCKNNTTLARMLHLGMPKCKCCGSKPSHIELSEIEPSDINRNTTAIYNATLYYSNGQRASVDHWHPLANGGANNISNFVAMCRRCNGDKDYHVFNSLIDLRLYVFGLRVLRVIGLSLSFKEFRSHLIHYYTWHHIL